MGVTMSFQHLAASPRALCVQAIREQRLLRLSYLARRAKDRYRRLCEPYWVASDTLLAYDRSQEAWRLFRLERLSALALDDGFRPRPFPGECDPTPLPKLVVTPALALPGPPVGYLDLEADAKGEITVVGLYLSRGEILQWVGEPDIDAIQAVLNRLERLYSYNGQQYDLPTLSKLGTRFPPHVDLRFLCHRQGIYGGLKGAETQLGIVRDVPEVDGALAQVLWFLFRERGSYRALRRLLVYNREDIRHLPEIRRRLGHVTLPSMEAVKEG